MALLTIHIHMQVKIEVYWQMQIDMLIQLTDKQTDGDGGLTMMGTRVPTTGRGVAWPRMTLDSTTLNTGSSVFTVWVRLIATAAKDRLAAT